MKYEFIAEQQGASEVGAPKWKEAGAVLGEEHGRAHKASRRMQVRPAGRRKRVMAIMARATAEPQREDAARIIDNFRLIRGAEKTADELTPRLRRFPAVTDAAGVERSRVCEMARGFLETGGWDFEEARLIWFLRGYFQEVAALTTEEIWMLNPALQMELIDRLIEAAPADWPLLVKSLRKLSESVWRELFEAASEVHLVLLRDPCGAWPRMDADSRDRYCKVLGELARHSGLSEADVASTAIELGERVQAVSDGSRATVRRTHVGYYLVDRHGRAELEVMIGYRPDLAGRISGLILRYPAGFYLTGIALLTLVIAAVAASHAASAGWAICAALLVILPATLAATDFINHLVALVVPPRVLPKLDFSDGIPGDCVTMIAVPTLLLNEAQIHDLVLDLEIRFLANRDRNLFFALLTDSADSIGPEDPHDARTELCRRLIEGLNVRYRREGRAPFFLFHRYRIFNAAEGCWMGWERKRGKLLDLNQMLRGGFDAFPVKVGDVSLLRDVRYVITLDSDTQLPRDSAAKLIGTMAHPLNQAVIDVATNVVVEGHGILQPRVGISVQSAARSRLAALYSGPTGFDIYTHAVSDVYQDLFDEGIYTGKGIYEVDVLRDVLERRFPENTLLSHDLIEGSYARAGLVTDIELIDGYPSNLSSWSRRKHRWLRGDWQIMRWSLPLVPDRNGHLVHNPLSRISRWKIVDNLRRSLLEAGLVAMLVSGWLWLPGRAAYWTAMGVLLWFLPVFSGLLFALLRMPANRKMRPAWLQDSARALWENVLTTLCSLIFLLYQALISMDAIVCAISRVFLSRKRMLEWESAAESEGATRPVATVDIYLECTPFIALEIAAAVNIFHPAALTAAGPLLVLWTGCSVFAKWLDGRPRAAKGKLGTEEVQLLRESADRIWRFFHDWSSASFNWLIPDSVRENGTVDLRLSPTNLGMLLNARIAAVHLGVMPLGEFIFETQQTLDQVFRLPKYRGHLFNWYDVASLEPLTPRFVSTVDSGNLAASLWTLKQAAMAMAGESVVKRGVTKEMAAQLRTIAERCERLVREMDFRFLYQRRRKTISIGYDVAAGTLHNASYNLLASEARIAAFVAIAKGDIPQECWFLLDRSHTLLNGEYVLQSWSGTMFEYMMPALWMRHYPDTMLDRALKAVMRVQREYGRRKGVPWGISESACLSGAEGEYGYKAFGVPELAMDRSDASSLVISPYSTFLAAAVDPAAAVENLQQMQKFGWLGRYGFYEAIDYTRAGGEAVRMWMAHHQGMSLLAIVNLLFDNPLCQYFHAEPQVMATELLLNERVPASALADAEPAATPQMEPMAA